ncbi:uncharacterized protein LOC141499581 [Macrotis lagotis]|uniref:uncharacterized protein LOC141499581 n=1 Tax=Macrotis lagotis TaxID=92651 RepID=UPI003D697E7A
MVRKPIPPSQDHLMPTSLFMKKKNQNDPSLLKVVEVDNLKKTLELETGYGDTNAWVDWIRYTVKSLNKSNCYACAEGRPVLKVVPFPLNLKNRPEDFKCILELFQERKVRENCNALSHLFPRVAKRMSKITSTVVNGKFPSCISRQVSGSPGEDLGNATCSDILVETKGTDSFSQMTVPRADLWWWCGGRKLRQVLPNNWHGTCALIQLAMPFTLAFVQEPESENRRVRRVASKSPLGSFDESVYLDEIGVPRGIPDEFKARNQVAAGFESLFWWVTINKNVDWINYIYYNQQRFINYTRTAVEGISEQLDATSRVAWENRMALDMMLAKEGGVCKMIGGSCCTFIPNNTAPDGSITRALQGLTRLSEELSRNSGINNPITGWLENWFGKWKGIATSFITSVIIAIAILTAVGCCIVPCIRGLVQRLIEKALTQESPPEYNNLQRAEPRKVKIMIEKSDVTPSNKECELILKKFEERQRRK